MSADRKEEMGILHRWKKDYRTIPEAERGSQRSNSWSGKKNNAKMKNPENAF